MKTEEVKKIISEAKNIYLIPSNSLEAVASAVALFYTLKQLQKNVNLLVDPPTDGLPEAIKFLIPSLDFISYPKNLVISIPNRIANVSQIYYEKNDEALKIHLTMEKGIIKKDDVSFYFSEIKPDLVISLGVADYQAQLKNMDAFGFLLDSPVLDIDNKTENKKFGKINLIEDKPLFEITMDLINNLNKNA